MGRVDDYRDELRSLAPDTWETFLDEHSGLPGPRANLALATALADLIDERADEGVADGVVDGVVERLISSGDEYRTFCGVVCLGTRAAGPVVRERLRQLAADPRWRVREAVAMALQRIGDRDSGAWSDVVSAWAEDADPLVQRAAAAGACEPPLLTTPERAATALDVCRRVTATLAALPATERRRPDVRTQRQALGYCWSVAVAADPVPGLRAFKELDLGDPDVAWIVRTNLGKKRLAPWA